MSETDLLACAVKPWVMKYHGSLESFLEYFDQIGGKKDGVCKYVMQGGLMRDLEGLYDEFTGVMKFPAYFGRNYNALSECLRDLEWLDCQVFIIFIADADLLLCEEDEGTLDGLLSIFANVGQEWSEPVSLGEEWDRSSVPFHVILQFDPKESARLQELPILDV